MAFLMKSASITTLIIILCMAMGAYDVAVVEAAISCTRVSTTLSPCIPYAAAGKDTTPSNACCSGIKSLNDAANTTPDRQSVCHCLKSIAGAFRNINYNVVEALPAKCGVFIPYRINPSTDCKSVK